MPAPRITTDFPAPMLAGQSPGRGDVSRGAGGDAAPGADAADEEPQAEIEVPIPIAAMARNMAEPPTALPMAARNSRRAIPGCLSDTRSPDRRIPAWTPNYRSNSNYRGRGDAKRVIQSLNSPYQCTEFSRVRIQWFSSG